MTEVLARPTASSSPPAPTASRGPGEWRHRSATQPVDGASLGFLRIGFGAIVAWEGVRYLDRGWVDRYYGGDGFTFSYWPFDFVQPLPEPILALPWMLMIVAGLWLAIGHWHRVAASLCLASLTYTLLLDKSQYLNHVYLMALVAFLLAVVPAGNALVAGRGRHRDRPVPSLAVDLVAFQVAVPYVFGGLAKLNGDWIAGRPLGLWLAESGDVPLLGPLFGLEPTGQILALASILFDLTIIGLLLHRRTRAAAFGLVVVFHLLNARLFSIGVFPWLMILSSTVFLPPDWPRLALTSLRDHADPRRRTTLLAAAIGAAVGAWFFQTVVPVHVVVTAFGFGLTAWLFSTARADGFARSWSGRPSSAGAVPIGRTKIVLVMAALWVAVQVTVPLRHHLYPTDVHWAEDGHRFSWRMKLRDKEGTIQIAVRDAAGQLHPVELGRYLRPRQISQLSTRPDMVIQFAHHLEAETGRDLDVFATSFVSLNGRQPAPFIRPDVELTAIEVPDFGPAWYVAPRPRSPAGSSDRAGT